MPSAPEVLMIGRRDIRRVMTPRDFADAVEQAFRAVAAGKASSPHPMHIPMTRGGFHAKGGSMSLGRDYVAVKINGNFPGNPAELDLPTIQGAVVLSDGHNGCLLAILDSMEVTLWRTAGASALAARYLAREDSRTLLICGAGEQGRAHVTALRDVLPIQNCLVWDRDHDAAEALAAKFAGDAGLEIKAVRELKPAALSADVIATCTSAQEPFLDVDMVKPGTFIAAVGTDAPHKSEIKPALMAAATVVADVSHQCMEMGDLNHAIVAGAMTEADVYAELVEVVTGAKPGRRSAEEIILFDSTGTGLQDVAAAAAICERSINVGTVPSIALAAA